MVFGNGVGIVVLKRLADALEDGDTICAVIRGSAINNDGSLKVGFTAPSVERAGRSHRRGAGGGRRRSGDHHATSRRTARPPRSATPQRSAALTKAYRRWTDKRGFCAIGSVKTNIGHLDAAAGVAGFIKTVLAMTHREIPPSLHFETPNPQIDFANSPFYVNTTLREWGANGTPRRAGVSSFGIGGTNAHVDPRGGAGPAAVGSGPSLAAAAAVGRTARRARPGHRQPARAPRPITANRIWRTWPSRCRSADGAFDHRRIVRLPRPRRAPLPRSASPGDRRRGALTGTTRRWRSCSPARDRST